MLVSESNGRYAQMIIRVEKKIGRSTSNADSRIVVWTVSEAPRRRCVR